MPPTKIYFLLYFCKVYKMGYVTVYQIWACRKQKFKKMYGTSAALKPSYLAEFMWRERYGKLPFGNMIVHIREKYNI